MIYRRFILALCLSFFAFSSFAQKKPNIILMMADDMGWGDTGFNGSKTAITPNLDNFAKDGAILNHFYSVGPVCSPTRASFVTGRHYYRVGVFYANRGRLAKQEYTMAQMMRENGYATGIFGKWHLGTLSETHSSKGALIDAKLHYAPPWERGFDETFITETSCVTLDVGKSSGYLKNPYYHNGKVVPARDNLDGDDSRAIMDRVIPFMEKSIANNKPFLSLIWFHTPHSKVLAGKKYLDMYPKLPSKAAHYFGAITAMDEQIGRLRAKLKELNIEDDTLVFFCSDNGPSSSSSGSTGGLRGRKCSIYDGGCRVPAMMYFPKNIKAGTFCDVPMSILDLLPTVAGISNASINTTHILDGEYVLDIIEGKRDMHTKSIPLRSDESDGSYACLLKGKYKLIIQSPDNVAKDVLYDLSTDRKEAVNVIDAHPELAKQMRAEILEFLESAKKSHAGEEYGVEYTPINKWQELGAEFSIDLIWNPTAEKKAKSGDAKSGGSKKKKKK